MKRIWIFIAFTALVILASFFYYSRNFYRIDPNYRYIKRHYSNKLIYLNRQVFYNSRPYAYNQDLKTVLLHPDYFSLPLKDLADSNAVIFYAVPYWRDLNNEEQLKVVKAVFKNYNFRVGSHSVIITYDTLRSGPGLLTEFLTDSISLSDSMIVYTNDKVLCKKMGLGICKLMHCRKKSLIWEMEKAAKGQVIMVYFYGKPLRFFALKSCALYYKKRLVRLYEQEKLPGLDIKFFPDGYLIYNPKVFLPKSNRQAHERAIAEQK